MKPENVPGVVLANNPGSPLLPQDNLTLPDGRRLGDVDGSELTRILLKRNIPGVSHSLGKAANAEAYEKFLAKLADDAGKAAFATWAAQGAA